MQPSRDNAKPLTAARTQIQPLLGSLDSVQFCNTQKSSVFVSSPLGLNQIVLLITKLSLTTLHTEPQAIEIDAGNRMTTNERKLKKKDSADVLID